MKMANEKAQSSCGLCFSFCRIFRLYEASEPQTLTSFMRRETHKTYLQLVYDQLHCLLQEDPVFVVKTVLNRTVDIEYSV